jgi:hypothetical protein
VLEDGAEARQVHLALQEQAAYPALNVDDIAGGWFAELEDGEGSGHAGVSADVVGDDLQGAVQHVGGFNQVLELSMYGVAPADGAVKSGLVHNGPQAQWCIARQDGLAAQPYRPEEALASRAVCSTPSSSDEF